MLHVVSYFDAVRLWWGGDLDPNSVLWGVPIFAWERIGKLLSFAGGLTVILDIVGAPAVRKAGTWVRSLITVRSTLNQMFYSILFAIRHIVFLEGVVYALGSFA